MLARAQAHLHGLHSKQTEVAEEETTSLNILLYPKEEGEGGRREGRRGGRMKRK